MHSFQESVLIITQYFDTIMNIFSGSTEHDSLNNYIVLQLALQLEICFQHCFMHMKLQETLSIFEKCSLKFQLL